MTTDVRSASRVCRPSCTSASPGHVERARRLVEDQQRRVGQERPRERDELPLAGRQAHAALVHLGVVAVGHRRDEVVHADRARRRLDLGGVAPGLPSAMFAPIEPENRYASCVTMTTARRRSTGSIVRRSRPSSRTAPGAHVVEPGEQLGDRRLARSGLADERDATGPRAGAGPRAAARSVRCRSRTRRRRTGRRRGRCARRCRVRRVRDGRLLGQQRRRASRAPPSPTGTSCRTCRSATSGLKNRRA